MIITVILRDLIQQWRISADDHILGLVEGSVWHRMHTFLLLPHTAELISRDCPAPIKLLWKRVGRTEELVGAINAILQRELREQIPQTLQQIFAFIANMAFLAIVREACLKLPCVMAWIEKDHWLRNTRANDTGSIVERYSLFIQLAARRPIYGLPPDYSTYYR